MALTAESGQGPGAEAGAQAGAQAGVSVRATPNGWAARGQTYLLEVDRRAPKAVLKGLDGRVWTELALESNVDTIGSPDETAVGGAETSLEPAGADDEVCFTRRRASGAWDRAWVSLRCGPRAVRLSAGVSGPAPRAIADVIMAGGRAVRATGACGEFRSGIGFDSLFVPAPTSPVWVSRPAGVAARLGVVGDAAPGRLHAVFSPPPLVFAFSRLAPGVGAELPPDQPAADGWLAAGVVAPLTASTFTTVSFEPLDGGWWLRLAYEGHTTAARWVSPELVFEPVASPWEALERYRAWCGAPDRADRPVGWWTEPIFCGWGAQCALAAGGEAPAATVGPPAPAMTAPEASRQDLYDRWLERLEALGVIPGTIVIDDKWQAAYGTMAPDLGKWPDLGGWIAARHRRGQRVLLWFKAWDPEGLPPDECVLDPFGAAVAADPSNPAYRQRLEAIVEKLIGPAGLDADGFKVDFTQRAPSGRLLRARGPEWGVAALHMLLRTVRRAAKRVKPDALIVTHTVNPLFRDVMDMARLNDVFEVDSAGRAADPAAQLAFRARVARAALGDVPLDTDQWPMPDKASWLGYARAQVGLGVPALYYVDRIDSSGEPIGEEDLRLIAGLWSAYRQRIEVARSLESLPSHAPNRGAIRTDKRV